MNSKSFTTAALAACAAALLLCALSARAAVITWSAPVTIAGDTDVSTAGTLVSAYSLNNAAVTINGVAFANGSGSLTSLGSTFAMSGFTTHYAAFGGGTSTPYKNLSSAYTNLLANGDYVGNVNTTPVITIQNLTFGEQYAVQVWANDSRTGRAAANYANVYSTGGGNNVAVHYNSTGAVGGVGQWTVGTFVADGTTQTFSILGNAGSGQNDTYLNALQLRDLGAATFGIGYWNGLAGDNALNYTSLNFSGNLDTAPVSSISLTTLETEQNACYFADSYYANSTVNAVTANNLTVGTGGVSIGTLNFENSAVTYTLTSSDANGITGATVVNKSGNGTVILDGANTYSGGTVINLGTVQVGNGDANGTLGSGPVTDLAALVFNRSDSPTFNNVISGAGTVTQMGSGTLALSGVNTYSGGTTISAGTLAIGGSGQLGGGAYAGAIVNNGILDYNSSASQTLSGVISGAGGALQQTGSGVLTLSGANTYGGGTTIGAGSTLQLNAGAGAGTGTIAISGNGSLTLNAATSFLNAITGGSTSVINVNEPTGNTLLKGDLSGFTGTINCNKATTSGQLVVNVSTFAISSAATWNIANGATLDLATPVTADPASVIVAGVGNNQIYGSLRLDACDQQGTVLLTGPNVLIGDGNTTGPSTISGVISDGGHGYGFTKVGAAATITLTAANTFSGPVTNMVGTLALSGAGSIANASGISLTNGTVFDVSAVNGGTYYLGAGQTLATLGGGATVNGNLDVSSGSPLSFQYNAGAPLTVTVGTLNLNNNPVTVNLTGSASFASSQTLLVSGVSGTVSSSVVTFTQANASWTATPTLAIIGGNLYLTVNNPVIASYSPYTYSNLFIFAQGVPPTFSVTAIGIPAPSYQWYSNNVAIAGANNSSFAYATGTLPVGKLVNSCVASSTAGTATNYWVLNVVSTNEYPPYPLAVMQSTNASGTPVPPISYWRLDESDMGGGNQGRPCNDWVGGNIGTYANVNLGQGGYSATTDPTETSAQFGVYATSGSEASIPNSASLNPGVASGSAGNMSVECWINAPKQTVTGASVISQGTYANNDTFVLQCNYGGNSTDRYLRFYVRDASGTVHTTTSANVTPSGTWQHLVGVCNESAGTVSLYINGVQSGTSAGIGTTAGLASDATDPVLIGVETGGGQWDGLIDDVAIYNYALPAAEIAAHYALKGTAPTVTLLASTNVDYGAPLTLAPTSVLGTLPLYYSWSDSATHTVLATTAALTIPSATTDTYTLIVSNAFTPAVTNSVTVTAHQGAPSFASPGSNITPGSQSVYVGTPVTFSVLAYGTYPLSYQWYDGAGAILGATSPTYTATATLGATTYYCVASNTTATASGSVTLTGVALPTSLYAQTVLKSNPPPIAYWRLDEQDNGTGNYGVTAYDYVGGHNATYNGVNLQVPGYNSSDPDTAAQFGVYANPNSYVGEINNAASGIPIIDFTKAEVGGNAEFSVEAWVNSSASQTTGAGIVARGWNGGEQFALDCNADQFRFYIRNASGNDVTAQSTVSDNDGKWHHLVGVCDQLNGTARIYVDGGLAGAAYNGGGSGISDPSGATDAATDLICIGARAAAKTDSTLADQYVGTIDEVALYNYALSASQVLAQYEAGTNVEVVVTPTISAVPSGTDLVITFTGTLLSSTNVTGPYGTVPGSPSSPYTVPMTNAQYFRSYVP